MSAFPPAGSAFVGAFPRAFARAVAVSALVLCGATTAASARAETAEPKVEVRKVEDDRVRIEEVRVRGEVRRVVVRPKAAGMAEYEISPASGAEDPSQRSRRAGGERMWRIFAF
jgi:hypothetical protein